MPEMPFHLKQYFGILRAMRPWLPSISLAFLLILPQVPQALTYVPSSHQELAKKSQSVVYGTCLSRERGQLNDPATGKNIPFDLYKIKVLEVLKGSTVSEFKQLSGTRSERQSLGIQYLYAPPPYEVGKEYVWFFVGTVGEGSISVTTDAKGVKSVSKSSGGMSFEELKQEVKDAL